MSLWLSLARSFGTGMAVFLPLCWVLVTAFSTGNSQFSQLLYDASYYASIVLTIVLVTLALWLMMT